MIEILGPTELRRAEATGALVADILEALRRRSRVGTNLLDLDRWAREMIAGAGAVSCYVDYAPSFGRGPFGHSVCTSVNDAVLHGKPHDHTLADGDLLSLDLAVSLAGVVADAAISFVVGEQRRPGAVAMIEATEAALRAGIAAAGPGARIGDISHAIGSTLTTAGYPISTEFGGHGVGSTMHQDPHVPNVGRPGRGYRLRPGVVLARAVGHGGHGRPRHGHGRLDPAERDRLPHRPQRAHDRDHRRRRPGPHAPDPGRVAGPARSATERLDDPQPRASSAARASRVASATRASSCSAPSRPLSLRTTSTTRARPGGVRTAMSLRVP